MNAFHDSVNPLETGMLVGYNGRAFNNVVWLPSTGLLAYSAGAEVVVDRLSSSDPPQVWGPCHSTEITTMALSPDGQYLASAAAWRLGGSAAELCVRDVDTGSTVAQISLDGLDLARWHSKGVQAITFGGDRFLVSVGAYCSFNKSPGAIGPNAGALICLWDWKAEVLLASYTCVAPVYCIQWAASPSAGLERAALKWTLETGEKAAVQFFTAGEAGVLAFTFASRSGSRSGGGTGKLTATPFKGRAGLQAACTALCLEKDIPVADARTGTAAKTPVLAAASSAGVVWVWGCSGHSLASVDSGRSEITHVRCGVRDDGRARMLTAGVAGDISEWRLQLCRDNSKKAELVRCVELDGAITALAIDSTAAAGVAGTSEGNIWCLRPTGHDEHVRLVSSPSGAATVNAVVHDPSGRWVASASGDGSLRLYEAGQDRDSAYSHRHQQVLQFHVPDQACLSLAVHPFLDIIAAGYSDGSVHLVDVGSMTLLQAVKSTKKAVTALRYASSGRTILVGSAEGEVADIECRDPRSWVSGSASIVRHVRALAQASDIHAGSGIQGISVTQEASSDREAWLAIDSLGRLSVWELTVLKRSTGVQTQHTLRCVVEIPAAAPPRPATPARCEKLPPALAAFSEGGGIIVVCGDETHGSDARVHFYDVAGRLGGSVSVRQLRPSALALSARCLVVGGSEGQLVVLDLTSRDVVSRGRAHGSMITCVSIQDREIVSGGAGGWDGASDQLRFSRLPIDLA